MIVAGFLLLFILQSSAIALRKSNTWDESAHILAGYAYIEKGMDYLSPLNHPVFGRLLTAALPSIFLDLDFEENVRPEGSPESDFFAYSLKFLYENNVTGGTVLFLSRFANIILGAILGIYVFVWSRELWGGTGAYLSLFFYSLSPNILAHSSLATTDIPITVFFFISSFYLYRLTKEATPSRILAAGLALALAFTSKHTAFLLIPVLAASFVLNLKKIPALRLLSYYASILAVAYVSIWAIYGFRYHSGSPGYVPLNWEGFAPSNLMSVIGFFRSIKLLPESYLFGVAGVVAGTGTGKAAFLMGSYSSTGWWYYFPIAFLIKTPIPTIIFLIASLLYISRGREGRGRILFIIFPAAVVFTAMSIQNVNIGLRHILPVYPFVFVLIGFVPLIKTESLRLAKAVFYTCVLWYAASAAMIFPHQLAYFNELAGGPANGYKYLVDSNLDWGQDLKSLKVFMDENKIDKIKLAYFGLSDPKYFGIDYEYLPSYLILEPVGAKETIELKGWFAISATMLQGVYMRERDIYSFFRERRPFATVGYSIFIYRF
ncbi:MAG: glycosyltransferase family 39 protein [Deltaproteobacteria bacterium]|nr:glycosyltransferase family 39 protein [Deltaproteobacteria bacterium]